MWAFVDSYPSNKYKSIYELRKQFLEGSGPPEKKTRSMPSKSLAVILWMSSYFDRIGDKRPDKEGIYLPTWGPYLLTDSRGRWKLPIKLFASHSLTRFTGSIFQMLFQRCITFSVYTSSSQECRFTKCNFCTLINNEMYKASFSSADKAKLRALLDDHLKLQE